MGHLSDKDYADMAADYAANPLRHEEVLGPVEVDPAYLRKGRPLKDPKRRKASGKTPSLAVRLPAAIRDELRERVEDGQSDSESELVRRALVEYFHEHPMKS
ncbi:MAG: hypothetical protein K0U75_14070 [Actinomycetia bacterium]|nr:hypothetical protein [Actinomycetes bacterium]